MPFGVVGRMGSGMRQVDGFEDWSPGNGNFGGKYGAPRCNQWGSLRRTCAKVREMELQFGVVRGVNRGIAVLDRGPPHARGRGGFGGFCSRLLIQKFPMRRHSSAAWSAFRTAWHVGRASLLLCLRFGPAGLHRGVPSDRSLIRNSPS